MSIRAQNLPIRGTLETIDPLVEFLDLRPPLLFEIHQPRLVQLDLRRGERVDILHIRTPEKRDVSGEWTRTTDLLVMSQTR